MLNRFKINSLKKEESCLIDPKKELNYELKRGFVTGKKFPKQCILCYTPKIIKNALKYYNVHKKFSIWDLDLYEIKTKGKTIGLILSPIGAPASGWILERLIARGVKSVINIGTAGSLQYSGLSVGDLVLCTKSIRCEGTSYFYKKPSRFASPDKNLTTLIEKTLEENKLKFKKGPAITIDAPYRLSITKAKELRKENILVSDMEASAIFSISSFRKIRSAAIFIIADLATKDFKWRPKLHELALDNGFKNLLNIAISTLAKVK